MTRPERAMFGLGALALLVGAWSSGFEFGQRAERVRVHETVPVASAPLDLPPAAAAAEVILIQAPETIAPPMNDGYVNPVWRWSTADAEKPLLELGSEGLLRFHDGPSPREVMRIERFSSYLWRFDERLPANGESVFTITQPDPDVAVAVVSVHRGDCLPDDALPGWRCGVDLTALPSSTVRHGDRLALWTWSKEWSDLAEPTALRLVDARQEVGHVAVRLDAGACVSWEWGATCAAATP